MLSLTTAEKDRDLKRKVYAAHGVREFWIVSPEAQTAEVLESAEGGSDGPGCMGTTRSFARRALPS